MARHKMIVATHSQLMRLASEHFRDFVTARDVEFELEFLDVGTPEDLPAAVEGLGATAVRLDPDLSSAWLAQCAVQPLAVSRAQAADLFIKDGARWEPDLLLEKGLHDVIVRQGKSMELHDWAYVIGEGAELRIVAGVCLALGFKNMRLVSDRDDDLAVQRDLLQRLYMGCNIVALSAHSLTLQTVEASLLVSAIDLGRSSELSNDLAYFNFMREGGLVIDLKSIQATNAVLEEAMRAGLRVLPPHEATGASEILLAQRLGLASVVEPKEYLDSWFECLRRSQTENRPSV